MFIFIILLNCFCLRISFDILFMTISSLLAVFFLPFGLCRTFTPIGNIIIYHDSGIHQMREIFETRILLFADDVRLFILLFLFYFFSRLHFVVVFSFDIDVYVCDQWPITRWDIPTLYILIKFFLIQKKKIKINILFFVLFFYFCFILVNRFTVIRHILRARFTLGWCKGSCELFLFLFFFFEFF